MSGGNKRPYKLTCMLYLHVCLSMNQFLSPQWIKVIKTCYFNYSKNAIRINAKKHTKQNIVSGYLPVEIKQQHLKNKVFNFFRVKKSYHCWITGDHTIHPPTEGQGGWSSYQIFKKGGGTWEDLLEKRG